MGRFRLFIGVMIILVIVAVTAAIIYSNMEFTNKLILNNMINLNDIFMNIRKIYFVKEPLPYVYTNTYRSSHWEIVCKTENKRFVSVSTARYNYVELCDAVRLRKEKFVHMGTVVMDVLDKFKLKNKELSPLSWAKKLLNHINKKTYNLFYHNCQTATYNMLVKYCDINEDKLKNLTGVKLFKEVLSELVLGKEDVE